VKNRLRIASRASSGADKAAVPDAVDKTSAASSPKGGQASSSKPRITSSKLSGGVAHCHPKGRHSRAWTGVCRRKLSGAIHFARAPV